MEKRYIFAITLILIGLIVFLGNYIPVFRPGIIWPLFIIIVGLGMMFRELTA